MIIVNMETGGEQNENRMLWYVDVVCLWAVKEIWLNPSGSVCLPDKRH